MATKTTTPPAAAEETVPNPRRGRVSIRYYVVAGGNEVGSATTKPQAIREFNVAKKAYPALLVQLKNGDKVIDERKPTAEQAAATVDIPGLPPQPAAGVQALAARGTGAKAPGKRTDEELDAEAEALAEQIKAAPAKPVGPQTEVGKMAAEAAARHAESKAAARAAKKTTSAGVTKAPSADRQAALAKAADPKLRAKRDHDRPVANAAVREWAREKGHQFSPTGHVRKASIDAFLEAHPGAGVTGKAKIVLPGEPGWEQQG